MEVQIINIIQNINIYISHKSHRNIKYRYCRNIYIPYISLKYRM